MAKSQFLINSITKKECDSIILPFHYLSSQSKGYKSGFNYGCFLQDKLIGVAIFTGISVPELANSICGLSRHEQEGLFELSRFCLEPEAQKKEHNLSSWFLSKCIKLLRKDTKVRLILSYADSSVHKGTLYAATNFKYYGLSEKKKDFFYKREDGTFVKHQRGKVKGFEGEWRDRPQKHRFILLFDNTLEIKWKEEKFERIKK